MIPNPFNAYVMPTYNAIGIGIDDKIFPGLYSFCSNVLAPLLLVNIMQ